MKITINLTTLILLGILIFALLGGGFTLHRNEIKGLNEKLQSESNLKLALIDKITEYQNEKNEWVSEKLTLQESINNLQSIYSKLSSTQQELLNKVKEVEKKSTVIAAALIVTNVKIDSLLLKPKVDVDLNENTITFTDSTKNLIYNIVVGKAKPAFPDINPTLTFNKFIMPNTQFVEFHWKNDKKRGYPTSFSITNSNEYFRVVNLDSYVIPTAQKEILNPTKWQKFKLFIGKNGNFLITVGVAGAAGVCVGALFL